MHIIPAFLAWWFFFYIRYFLLNLRISECGQRMSCKINSLSQHGSNALFYERENRSMSLPPPPLPPPACLCPLIAHKGAVTQWNLIWRRWGGRSLLQKSSPHGGIEWPKIIWGKSGLKYANKEAINQENLYFPSRKKKVQKWENPEDLVISHTFCSKQPAF